MDNIEYGIYKIPDKNEVPPTRACCICDEYENKKARAALDGGADKAREPLQKLFAFGRYYHGERVQTEAETGIIPSADRSGILGNDNVKEYPPYLDYPKPRKPITNYDRVRAKSVEEMAEFFTQGYYDGPKFYCPVQPVIGEGECAMRSDCRQCWLDWLKQEARE